VERGEIFYAETRQRVLRFLTAVHERAADSIGACASRRVTAPRTTS
jgi:hypothetical protein